MGMTETGMTGPDGFRLVEYGMIGAVAQWCESLHGKSPLLKSLQMIGGGVDAEAISLVRYFRGGVGDGQPIIWDRAASDVRGGRLNRGYARIMLGNYFEATRPGSPWFRTLLEDSPTDLSDFHTARMMRELSIIPLDVNDRFIDTIEMHFSEKLRNFQQLLLNSLAPVLAQTWKNRSQGRFTEAALDSVASPQPDAGRAPILGSENPLRLSRAEYRVGLMLSRGMPVEGVKTALNIQESTLRTHLGNLYAKTQSANLSELIYRLVSEPQSARAGAAPRARSA